MEYDFDLPVDRYQTDCLKFDFTKERGHRPDALSYWVADMDFKTAPQIIDALRERVEHGIFGYTNIKDHYFEAVRAWLAEHLHYTVEREWLVETPGVVFALGLAVNALTEPGESILIQSPVYYPFSSVIRNAGRNVVSSPLVWNGTNYDIDFTDFEQKIIENDVRLFLLCNPHNPGGRSWKKEELAKLGELCLRHNVKVVSDEIHADFIWDGNVHTSFASISPELEDITVTCTAPSKSFNLAGLQVSNIFIKNRALRQRIIRQRNITGYDEPSVLGLTACEAAYTKGGGWFNAAKEYINGNLDKAVKLINAQGKGKITVSKPDATYLLWVDCHGLGLSDAELNRRIKEDGNLWLDPGNIFGPEGALFERFNAATQWVYLEKGLSAFLDAVLR